MTEPIYKRVWRNKNADKVSVSKKKSYIKRKDIFLIENKGKCFVHRETDIAPTSKLKCQKCLDVDKMAQREYKERHPDKIKESKRRHYLKNKEDINKKCREYSKNNRERLRIVSKTWRNKYQLELRIKVMGYYSNGSMSCECCGENTVEFLSIDHINGGGAAHRRSLKMKAGGYMFYRWLINNGYPGGFRVLCHNCNMSYGSFGFCPHQNKQKAIA
jgi:hypothetical protein